MPRSSAVPEMAQQICYHVHFASSEVAVNQGPLSERKEDASTESKRIVLERHPPRIQYAELLKIAEVDTRMAERQESIV